MRGLHFRVLGFGFEFLVSKFEFRVSGFRFLVSDLGFRASSCRFRVSGRCRLWFVFWFIGLHHLVIGGRSGVGVMNHSRSGFEVWGFGVQGLGCRVRGVGFGVYGVGCRVSRSTWEICPRFCILPTAPDANCFRFMIQSMGCGVWDVGRWD